MLLYFIVLMGVTKKRANGARPRCVVMGVVAVLSFHILVNVGMVVGFMPVTGMPPGLMSYDASSFLFYVSGVGHCNECPHAPFRELTQDGLAGVLPALAVPRGEQD